VKSAMCGEIFGASIDPKNLCNRKFSGQPTAGSKIPYFPNYGCLLLAG